MTVPLRFGALCESCLHPQHRRTPFGHCACGCPHVFPSVPSRTKQRHQMSLRFLSSMRRRTSGPGETLSDGRSTPSVSPRRGRPSESSLVALVAVGVLCLAFVAVIATW